MSANRALGLFLRNTSACLTKNSTASTALRSGAHRPPPPPFARIPAPTQPLLEEDDLVWNDGVAPELMIDFDAQHISRIDGLKAWLMGLSFFPFVGLCVWMYDPESTRKAEKREKFMPDQSLERGKISPPEI